MGEREATVEPVPVPSPTDASATEADNRAAVVAALMLAMGLAAIDSTIVATAVPQIVADLGGFSLFPWIFSIYLLTQAVTVPIYGRLSDIFGRKPVLLFGVAGFLVRVDPVRARLEHGRADRLPRGAGARRRRDPADDHDDRRRPLRAGRARPRSRATSPPSGASPRSSALRSAASSPSTGRGAASSGSICRSASAPRG